MNGLFITGTDTGVGKTALTAALLSARVRKGKTAYPIKPIQTGGDPERGALGAPDLMRCLAAARLSPPPDILCDLCPYLFAPPCSPHLAARDAETEIDLLRIHRAVKRVAKQADTVLVEGAGGVLVPLGGGMTMRDLMVELNLPVLLAARPGLGTLNHTLLSLQALEAAGLRPIGVVLVETEASNWGHIEDDNRHAIASLSGIPIVGRLPFCPQFPVGGALSPALCDAGDDIMRELDHCLDSQW